MRPTLFVLAILSLFIGCKMSTEPELFLPPGEYFSLSENGTVYRTIKIVSISFVGNDTQYGMSFRKYTGVTNSEGLFIADSIPAGTPRAANPMRRPRLNSNLPLFTVESEEPEVSGYYQLLQRPL